MEPLIVLVVLVVIITPILAIAAFARVQGLHEQLRAVPLQNLLARLYSLEQRLSAIEKTLSSVTPAATPSPSPAPKEATPVTPQLIPPAAIPTAPVETPKPREFSGVTPPVSVFAAPPLHTAKSQSSAPLDLETTIGARWFNRIGILALLVGVSFFLKYAFDNNWIGPAGRIAIGILLGAAMLPWSQWLLGRGYSYFSEGIAALGAAVLYLSIWAGCHYYTLFTRDVGFVAMIVVTSVMAAVALGRNSQRIALLSLFGGFLTPVLVSTGRDAQVVLFTYLLILGAGMLTMAANRKWLTLAPLSFLLTLVYFWGWYSAFYNPTKLERTIVFATLFFLLYSVLPVLRAMRRERMHELDILITLANAFAYLGALYAMLWPQDRWPLTLLVLALSGGFVAVARLVPAPKDGESPLARLLFAGLALTFVTLAIPIRLDGKWITLSLAVEGAILAWTGFRSSTAYLRGAGYLLLAISALRVLLFPLPAEQFLFNERFATYAVLIACFGAVLYAAREFVSSTDQNERNALGIFAVAINVYALIALSLELWDYFGHAGSPGLAQHLALSLLWMGYATGLILLGSNQDSSLLRWQALVLFGIAVTKVFLYDSSFLDRFYRIISFVVLGLVLVVVSFLYQRKDSRGRSSP
jgi:uncharacterized membrane protein